MTAEDIGRAQKEKRVPAFEKKEFAGLPVDVFITTEGKPGRSKLDRNQDAFVFNEEIGLLGVVDGMSQSNNAAEAAKELAAYFPDAVKIAKPDAINLGIEEMKKDLEANYQKRGVKPNSCVERSVEMMARIDEKLVRKAWILLRAAKDINPTICKTGGMATGLFTLLHKTEEDGRLFAITLSLGDCGMFTEQAQINEEDSLYEIAVAKGWIDPRQYIDPSTNKILPGTMIDIKIGGRVVKSDTYRALRNAVSTGFGNPKEEPVPDITFHEIHEKAMLLATDGLGDRVEQDGVADRKKMFEFGEGKTGKEWVNQCRVAALNATDSYKDPDDTTVIGIRRTSSRVTA